MIRDLIYIWYEDEKNSVWSYGLEFKEFILGLDKRPNNILILSGDYWQSEFDYFTRCCYCVNEDIDHFIEEDIYNYGDFVWVDFENIEDLRKMKPEEVAELYYIGRKREPISNIYYKNLNNRFVYTAHDDGWSNLIYYNDINDFDNIFGNIIIDKIQRIYNLELKDLDLGTLHKLRELSIKGISIDLLRLKVEEDSTIVIPIYRIGNLMDMDKVYELSREVDVEVAFELRLNSEWNVFSLEEAER